jgi:hypothetical protein
MRVAAMVLFYAGAGCSGGGAVDGGADTAEPPTDTDTDGDPPAGDPEGACDDQDDNDGDGDIDCADSDCATKELCTWPAAIDFETLLQYEASGLAQLAGYEDCTVHITAPLERNPAESCDGCDRVYSGPFEFLQDDCPPEIERPADGGYGIDFQTETTWEVFGRVDGVWTSLGIAEDDGSGTLQIADTVPVIVEGVDGGDLTTYFQFTPR